MNCLDGNFLVAALRHILLHLWMGRNRRHDCPSSYPVEGSRHPGMVCSSRHLTTTRNCCIALHHASYLSLLVQEKKIEIVLFILFLMQKLWLQDRGNNFKAVNWQLFHLNGKGRVLGDFGRFFFIYLQYLETRWLLFGKCSHLVYNFILPCGMEL